MKTLIIGFCAAVFCVGTTSAQHRGQGAPPHQQPMPHYQLPPQRQEVPRGPDRHIQPIQPQGPQGERPTPRREISPNWQQQIPHTPPQINPRHEALPPDILRSRGLHEERFQKPAWNMQTNQWEQRVGHSRYIPERGIEIWYSLPAYVGYGYVLLPDIGYVEVEDEDQYLEIFNDLESGDADRVVIATDLILDLAVRQGLIPPDIE